MEAQKQGARTINAQTCKSIITAKEKDEGCFIVLFLIDANCLPQIDHHHANASSV